MRTNKQERKKMNTCSRWMWVVAFALSTVTVMYVGDACADLAGVGESAFQKVAPSLTPVGISDSSLLSKDEVSVPQRRATGRKASSSAAKSEKTPQESVFRGISTERIKECLDKGMYNHNGVETKLSQGQRKALEAELAARREAHQITLTDQHPLANVDSKTNQTNSLVFTVHHEKANVDIEVHCVDELSRQFADEIKLGEMILANTNLVGLTKITDDDVDNFCENLKREFHRRLFFLATLKPKTVTSDNVRVEFDCGRIERIDFTGFRSKNPFDFWPFSCWPNMFGSKYISRTNGTEGLWFSSYQITNRYFASVKEGDVFNYEKVRSSLFNVNSQPDLTVNMGMKAYYGDTKEGSNTVNRMRLELGVVEELPFHGMFEINNYGMEEIEEWQASLTFQYLNLWKRDHVLTLSPSISFGGELFSFAGSYMAPHYWWLGGNTTLYGGYSRLDVDNIVPRLDLEGTGEFVGLQHSEYLWDDDKRLVALSAGALWRYIEDRYTAYSRKLNGRDVSILPLSLALSYTRKKDDCLGGRNFATVQGVLNVMNSGDRLNEMWTDADKNYWILRWQAARLQPLPCPQLAWPWNWRIPDKHQWLLFMKLEGQYTTDTLIPVEKLSMGGYNCMRGYHTRGYLGDYGTYGTLELRTPILVNGVWQIFEGTTQQRERLQFLTFLDFGWTAFNDLPSSYDDNEFIYSAGIGARWSVTKYMQLKCDIAFPLRDTDWADDDDMEIYFSAQFQF